MKVQTYILGFLLRYGPQHGYRLKQLIAENASDFTRIKLPTIYYHLEKMLADGLLSATGEQEGRRPERMVYEITEKGKTAWEKMLLESMNTRYEPEFIGDAVLYFSDALDSEVLRTALQKQAGYLEAVVGKIGVHRGDVMSHLPGRPGRMAVMIIDHHLAHYQTELQWIQDVLRKLATDEA